MSTIKVDTVQSTGGGAVTLTNQEGAKARVSFDGTSVDGTADLTGVRGSFNITSLVDTDTGDHTVNYTNNMNDANYTLTSATISDLSANRCVLGLSDDQTITTSQARIHVVDTGNNALRDQEYNFIAVHGDLA